MEKNVSNLVCRRCPQCFRQNPAPITQPIGQLPKARITPNRAFTVVGVDYCGPVYIKPPHRKAAPRKAYIAVFVCFATKAVHLELVCDLSTNAFIAALRRFIAHHGMPTEIHSDNGTNFQGASNTLLELYKFFENKRTKEAIMNECSLHRIKWHFIPPRAPSFGGLWEAAVKTAKTSLIKTIGNGQLSFEDYATVLCQIEANMNSRPLTSLSNDPEELDVLTPGHFIIGSPLIRLPEPNYRNIPIHRLDHYQQLQKLIQQHWDRWRKEYLTELNHQREKSTFVTHLKVGQVVLVKEDGKASISWPLGRIEQVHPGADGVVRVVTVKTASSCYKRPISRIYPLPCHHEPNIASDDDSGAKESKKIEN
jgi:transposase InsO family protein